MDSIFRRPKTKVKVWLKLTARPTFVFASNLNQMVTALDNLTDDYTVVFRAIHRLLPTAVAITRSSSISFSN